jgi:hypothetical protein
VARILFSSLAQLNEDETDFLALTCSQMAARGDSFVFLSPHEYAALSMRTVRIPDRLGDWCHFFPAEAAVRDEAMSRIDVPLWIRRIQYHEGAVDGGYDCRPLLESLAGAALMLLRTLAPHVVVAWNPSDPTLGVLAEIAKSLGVEVWGNERGHLPGTFVVDRQLSGIWQSVNGESLEGELSRRDFAQLGSEFLQSAYSHRFLRYPVDDQRSSGGVAWGAVQGTPKVLVIGCFDAAIGLMPADPKRSQDLPNYDSGFDIVRHVATAHSGVTVFKPHPCMAGWRFSYDCRPLPNVVIGDGDIRDYVDWADVVVGYGSSMDFAAMSVGKPLVLCGRSPLWQKGIAYEALEPAELSDAIKSALQKEHWEARADRFASLVGYLASQRWLRIDTPQHRMVAARKCAELVASAYPSSSDGTDLTQRLAGLRFAGHADRNIAVAPKNPVWQLRQAEDAQRQAEDELNRIKTSLTWRSLRPLHLAIDCLRGLFTARRDSATACPAAEKSAASRRHA